MFTFSTILSLLQCGMEPPPGPCSRADLEFLEKGFIYINEWWFDLLILSHFL